jgi:hypothetical protein
MKKTRSVHKASGPAKPIQGSTLSEEKENKRPDESFNLSPARLMNGASTTTALLNQILAQREEVHPLRDWRINE